ncbi:MAG: polysaccharide biosynthesis/export family protein [Pseudomonadota bacterium]
MKTKILIICLVLFVSPIILANEPVNPESIEGSGARAAEVNYKIGPGDVLDISVWKEEGLDKRVLVRPDGGITFPLIGNLNVMGITINELQQIITSRLANYIASPVVTISVSKIAHNKIYVIGKVQKPGEYLADQYIDVMQVLARAGGFTPFADEDEIKILRRVNGNLREFHFDYDAFLDGERPEQNIILQSGDVVVVP